MSCTENSCKIISHIAFKELNLFDIYGMQTIIEPVKHNFETKIIEIMHNNESKNVNADDNDSKVVKMPSVKSVMRNNEIRKQPNVLSKRVISETYAWKNIDSHELDIRNQFRFIEDKSNIPCVVSSELRKKISSYKSQDKRKNLFNISEFIDFEFILTLLAVSELKCYYCSCNVYILYDIVRELKQWTVERLDNRLGHNKNNCVISCLECNLRRRTMYHENYLLTKQMKLTKVVS
jgi:hypothetical protein